MVRLVSYSVEGLQRKRGKDHTLRSTLPGARPSCTENLLAAPHLCKHRFRAQRGARAGVVSRVNLMSNHNRMENGYRGLVPAFAYNAGT